jgi:NodT family efflux transporter outer membrane factor (OMF) lipoprotein
VTDGQPLARGLAAAAAIAAAIAGGACTPQPKYVVPTTPPAAPAFKEASPDLKAAQPADRLVKGAWWEAFGDPRLNALEQRVQVSNQNLAGIQAQFVEARAALRATRSGFYPRVNAAPSINRASASQTRATPAVPGSYADFLAPVDVAWEPDVWGRVRASVEASRTFAEAAAADVETISLSIHAELATDYFSLRGLDAEKQLLDAAVESYAREVELTQNRFRGGLSSAADVAQAETQLETTRAQQVDVGVARAAFEHAIAVIIGEPPSSFSLAPAALDSPPPVIPPGLPSELLERRPDVASAERRVASANADVGVANSAFFPALSLSVAGGFESSSIGSWFSGLSGFWTTGTALLYNLFDAGRRRALSDEARAAYDQTVASYRQTVLVAFREVEDQLAALRILEDEAAVQARAVQAADRSLTLANNRYRGGVSSYLEVITAQNAALTNQRAAATLLTRRVNATVLLVKALGGGWSAQTTTNRVAAQ